MKRMLWICAALGMMLAACVSPAADASSSASPADGDAPVSQPDTATAPTPLPDGPPAPKLTNETWLNTEPLTSADLRGNVVLIDFWTFG